MNFLADIKFKPDQYKLLFKELSTIFSSFNALWLIAGSFCH